MAFGTYTIHQSIKIAMLTSNLLLFSIIYLMESGKECLVFKYYFPEEFLQISLPLKSPSMELGEIDHFVHLGVNSTLLNIPNFKYILNNETLCPAVESEWNIMLIIVHTARNHVMQRNSIRTTWGSVRKYQNWKIRLVFMVGMGSSDTKSRNNDLVLRFEAEKHGDIVEGNFIDSYRNMTYKHLMGYQWALTFCEHANYIFKVDDDVFANIFGVINILNKYSQYSLICPILIGQAPNRGFSDKWYVHMEEYASPLYPPYCLGAGYLMSMKWVRRIHSAAAKVKFFWIDDVFVTGILREYAQVQVKEKMALVDLHNIWVETTEWDFVASHSIHPFYNTGKKFFAVYCYMGHSYRFVYDMKMLWEKSLRLYFLNSYQL